MKRSPFLIGLVLAMCFLVSLTSSFDAGAQAVLVPSANTVSTNSLAQAAANVGVKQCLPALTELSALGMRGSARNDVLFDWDRKRAGAGPIFSLVGLQYADDTAAMSVTSVPEKDGSCTVSAERISVAAASCQTVAHDELTAYRPARLLDHMVVYTEAGNPGSSVSLLDVHGGCLMIRRYVKFSSKNQTPAR